MHKASYATRILAGCLICLAGATSARAAKPTPADVLRFRPLQEGVNYSTPAAQEIASCQVELVSGAGTSSGWLLSDGRGRPLRRFFDSNGDKRPDVWSYYLDGVEVYREIDTTYDGRPDQFRWLNVGGMKLGIDLNKDGKIDTWKMISAEEVSQEVLQALVGKDFRRMQALFLTNEELTGLGLTPQETSRLQESMKLAGSKFQAACAKLTGLAEKTRWIHLETGAPQCIPADQSGAKFDLIKYGRATLLCETNNKHDWIQIGEMIRYGAAWRLIDSPTAGEGGGGSESGPIDPQLQALLDQLRDLDTNKAPKTAEPAGIAAYNIARADLLEQVANKVKPEEREQWIKQIADCLSAAAQNSGDGDKTAYQRLVRLEEQIVEAVKGSSLAAYVTFREMTADNAARLAAKSPDVSKIQEQWLQRLAKFVDTYPNAEDTPEALMQLGMVSEFINKEIEAKKWYELIAKKFSDNVLAPKAQGALRRLELEGKSLELSATTLNGTPFDLAQLKDKLVVVYYWASWNRDRTVADFTTLKTLLNTYGGKGLELVCVNLDNTVKEAADFLQRSPAPGIHLYQPGGLDSPLAMQYGVMVLPNLFLVDRQGKVLSRTVQVANLEDELKKKMN